MRLQHPLSARRTGGFSLIEVLIALVILSVGLLGIAAMVAVSMKSKYSSYQRSQASALAYGILDRMRANRAPAAASMYDVAVGNTVGNALTSQSISGPPSGDCTGTSANCNTSQIAALDLAQWKAELANTLTSGDGSISTASLSQMTQVIIKVQWNDSRADQATGAPSSATALTTFELDTGL